MTTEQIVERLRDMIYDEALDHVFAQRVRAKVEKLLQELDPPRLDPPRPKPDTVVWWRFKHHETYRTGLVADGGDGVIDYEQEFHEWLDIEWKPARILAPDDHGEEAYSDVLQDRIQAALEYIDVMWKTKDTGYASYQEDLLNLTSILDGRAKETE